MFPIRDTQKTYSTPVVTIILIVVNVLVFLYEFSLGSYEQNHFIASYALVPDRLHPYSLITSMFLHGGWLHVLGNMWFLWIFGDNVEDVLGHRKFFFFYLICGVAAAVAHIFFNPFSRVPTVGASGAIAGVMGAYLIKFPRHTIQTAIFVFVFFTVVEVPAMLMLAYWFVIQLFSGLGSIGYSQVSQGGVAWFAHVGGFVAGMILISVMGARSRSSRRRDLYW